MTRTIQFHHLWKLPRNASIDLEVTAKVDIYSRDVTLTSVRILATGEELRTTKAVRLELEAAAVVADDQMRWERAS